MKWLIAVMLAAAVSMATFSSSAAGDVIASAKEMWKTVNGLDPNADIPTIERLLWQNFDVEQFAGMALINFWQSWTDEQKQEFKEEFILRLSRNIKNDLHRTAYKKKKVVFSVKRLDKRFAEIVAITRHEGKRFSMELFLINRDGKWLTYDLNIEGANLIRNYRAQFNKFMRLYGYEGLIRKLKEL